MQTDAIFTIGRFVKQWEGISLTVEFQTKVGFPLTDLNFFWVKVKHSKQPTLTQFISLLFKAVGGRTAYICFQKI